MNQELRSAKLADRFDHLLLVIGSQRFLLMEGIGNEVPFVVVPFDPAEAVEMEKLRKQLIKKLEHKGVRVLEIQTVSISDITASLGLASASFRSACALQHAANI